MLKPNFKIADIEKAIAQEGEKQEQAVLSRLQRIGELGLTYCRQETSYKDRTGVLRSSLGYIIIKNGLQLYKGGFIQIMAGGEGVAAGEKIAKEVTAKYPVGLVLIMVAGAAYAVHVEATGRPVLTAGALVAKNALEKAMREISRKAA